MNLENKTSMEIRLLMKELGWDSHDDLTTNGWENGYGYSIWFERYDWHGRNTFGLTGHHVCFHRHTNDLDKIDNATKICADQALKAYQDYTDCIPLQNAYNETQKDIMFVDWNDERVLLNK